MTELYANNFGTILTSPAGSGDGTISVQTAAPAALQGGQFRVVCDAELLLVTGGAATTTWTVTRGVEGTSAAGHQGGATVAHVLTAASLAALADDTAAWMAAARSFAIPDLVPAAPTITQGVANAATVIAGGVDYLAILDPWGSWSVNPIYRYSGGPVSRAGAGFPDMLYAAQILPSVSYNVTFWTDADEFEFQVKGTAGKYRLWVNGKRVTAGPVNGPPSDGNGYRIHVDFGSAGGREITIDMMGAFGCITVGPTYTVTAPVSAAPTIRCIVMGDSYTEPVGSDAYFTGYVRTLGRCLGWDTWCSGWGGTGYLEPGAFTTFRDRVAADVIAYTPDVVIVAGGLNDPEAGLQAEAELLYAAIQAGLPSAKLVALSPWCPRGGSLSALLAVKTAALAAAAATAGVQYIDTSTHPWLTGTGDAAGPNGTGNSDIFIGADHSHPTQAGHDYIGYRLAGHLW